MKKRHRRNFSKKPLPQLNDKVIHVEEVLKISKPNANRRVYSTEALARAYDQITIGTRLAKVLTYGTFIGEMEHHLTNNEKELGIHG